jgi:hypothetical protein
LQHHPHVHCVVPGGGLGRGGTEWVSTSHCFLLPVRVLSRVFRGKYLAGLRRLYEAGELTVAGQLAPLQSPRALRALCRRLRKARLGRVHQSRPSADPMSS